MTRCNTCKYGVPNLSPNSTVAIEQPGLLCKRNPPRVQAVVIPTPQGVGAQMMTMFPQVRDSDFCGEWRPQSESFFDAAGGIVR